MKFGIIYSCDGDEVTPAMRPPSEQLFIGRQPAFKRAYGMDIIVEEPPAKGELWTRTEQENESDYDFFNADDMFDSDDDEQDETIRHEKWCACLNLEQFEEFLSHACIYPQDVETMGSLGAPTPDGNICLGIMPAVSFDCNGEGDIRNAYVTPYIEDGDDELIPGLDMSNLDSEETWELVKRWMLDRWA